MNPHTDANSRRQPLSGSHRDRDTVPWSNRLNRNRIKPRNAEANVIRPGSDGHHHNRLGLHSYVTSDLLIENVRGSEDKQKSVDVEAIESEALTVMQKWVRYMPPVSKGAFPFRNPGMIDKPLGCRKPRGAPPGQRSQQYLICWRCYASGHLASECTLDFESQAYEVIENSGQLTLEEKGLFRLGLSCV